MDTKEVQTKKDAPILERSMMLTRFKLSQQKRQLREKDNHVSLTTLKRPHSVSKSGDSKKLTPQKSSTKCNKEKQAKKLEKVELYPNKLKRNKVVKKIVLKPKNELKVIGWTNAVKRKRRESENTITSPNVKIKRNNHRKISLDLSLSETDNRSQSPVYSELGFEEVLRMADENEYLNDEDLMEILTCPSPVWWEDPPDEGYTEDPIVFRANTVTSLPDTMTQRRSKQSRKRRPQKVVTEPARCRVNDDIVMNEQTLNTELLKNKKCDMKFNKKHKKLEGLLNIIRAKGNQTANGDNKKESTEKIKNDVVSTESTSNFDGPVDLEQEVPGNNGDTSYLDILDIDGLKYLENIEIPMENKAIENARSVNETDKSLHLKSILSNGHFDIINDKSRAMTMLKNKTLKILNVKHVSPGVLTLKSIKHVENIKNTNKIKDKEVKEELKNDKEVDGKVNTTKDLNVDEKYDISIELKQETTKDNEEYVTVFEIINSDDEMSDIGNMERKHTKTETNRVSSESEQNVINAYYKKCKNTRRSKNTIERRKTKKSKEDKFRENCNYDTIVVPNSDHVKYCRRCSSIFDADVCSYCVKKEQK